MADDNFDPFGAFGQAVDVATKARANSPYAEERKARRELQMYGQKKAIDARYDTKGKGVKGVYSYNPFTKKVQQEGEIPENAVLRNTLTEEDMATKYGLRNQFESPTLQEAQAKTNAQEMIGKSRELQQILLDDKDWFGGIGSTKIKAKVPFNAFSKTAQRYEFVKGDLADRILRLRSGASINEQEANRLLKLLPSVGRFDEVDIQGLQDFENEFSNLAGRINSGVLWDKTTQSFKSPMNSQNFIQQAAQSQQGGGQPPTAYQGGTDSEAIKQRLRQRYYGK